MTGARFGRGSHGRPMKCAGTWGHHQLMADRSLFRPVAPRRHRLWSLLGGFAVVLVACMPVGAQPSDLPRSEKEIERALRRAEKDLDRGDYPAAGEAARGILAHSSPQGELRGRALTVLGKVLFFNSRVAFRTVTVPPGQSLADRPEELEKVEAEKRSREEGMRLAEEALREAIRLGGPSGREARHYLAQLLYTLRRPDEAAAELEAFFVEGGSEVSGETERRATLLQRCLEHVRFEPGSAKRAWVTDPRVAEGESPQPRPVLLVEGEIASPRRVSTPTAQYTEAARRALLQGFVLVQVIIGESGQVLCARPLKGLPLGLTEATLDAVWQWTWKPAKLDDRAVAVFYNLTTHFQFQ